MMVRGKRGRTPWGGRRRPGFTLIEILVVIAIIGVLMGLLLAGVMRVMLIKQKTETTARFTAINNAVTTAKGNQTAWTLPYIPQGGYLSTSTGTPAVTTWQPFRLRNNYQTPATAGDPGTTSPEAQFLAQVFGGGRQLNWSDLGFRDSSGNVNNISVNLDANQTLTFFLTGIPQVSGTQAVFTGFSTNSQQPFLPRVNPTDPRNGPLLDLGGSSKYVIDASGFARLTDAYGNPFAYFAAYQGLTNQYYAGNNSGVNNTVPIPYAVNGQYLNAGGFQLISAGKDGLFGADGKWPPADHNGSDDLANFSPSALGAGN